MAPKVRFLSLKIYLLRLVIICSSICLILQCSAEVRAGNTFGIILTSCIFLHHLLDFLHPEFLFGIVDLVLLGAEIAKLPSYLKFLNTGFNGWDFPAWVLYVVLFWMITVSLSLEAILRAISAAIYFSEIPFKPFHLSKYWGLSPSRQDMPKPHHALFGRSIWKEHFKGESLSLRLSRGTVAVICIATISVFSVFGIILGPIAESALIPVKDIRSPNLPPESQGFDPIVWNVVVARSLTRANINNSNIESWSDILHSAVEVTPLWDDSWSFKPACNHFPDSRTYNDSWPILQAITINCPSPNLNPNYLLQPDLLVVVNFTKLGLPTNSITEAGKNGVQILVAATNNTDHAVYKTISTTIPAGVNLMGGLYIEVRQIIKRPALSSLGIFLSSEVFYHTPTIYLYPDPQASRSPLIPSSPDISTLRIFMPNDFSEWRIVQESRERSVVNGFSNAGGLWTFLSGIFAAIFGSSLMRILLGKKPISVFGVAHRFQHARIQEACVAKYPKIPQDLDLTNSKRGLLSLLADEVIDLGFLQGDETTETMDKEGDFGLLASPSNEGD